MKIPPELLKDLTNIAIKCGIQAQTMTEARLYLDKEGYGGVAHSIALAATTLNDTQATLIRLLEELARQEQESQAKTLPEAYRPRS